MHLFIPQEEERKSTADKLFGEDNRQEAAVPQATTPDWLSHTNPQEGGEATWLQQDSQNKQNKPDTTQQTSSKPAKIIPIKNETTGNSELGPSHSKKKNSSNTHQPGGPPPPKMASQKREQAPISWRINSSTTTTSQQPHSLQPQEDRHQTLLKGTSQKQNLNPKVAGFVGNVSNRSKMPKDEQARVQASGID